MNNLKKVIDINGIIININGIIKPTVPGLICGCLLSKN